MRILCFKPMRNVHESGYRYIQYGYMASDEKDEEIEIVGRYDLLTTPYETPIPCNIDLTKSGWFRILPRKNIELEWQYGGQIAEVNPKERECNRMSDLKIIIELLPGIVEGRELTLALDKSDRMWYVGHPTLDGDFSVGLYGWDKDVEGAALSLLSQLDKKAAA